LANEGSEVAAAVDSALEEIERLQQLASDLLVLARARSGASAPGDRLDLAEISERAATAARRSGTAEGIAIAVDGAAAVVGDADAIERAVTNLVQNAARHARSRVTVDVASSDGSVTVRVRDDGPGFSDAVIGRAGERFVSGAGGGVGLGLAIVGEIATAHGGQLELADDDVGAVALLRFPAPTRP
jgi:signal transduction histidine kinase